MVSSLLAVVESSSLIGDISATLVLFGPETLKLVTKLGLARPTPWTAEGRQNADIKK